MGQLINFIIYNFYMILSVTHQFFCNFIKLGQSFFLNDEILILMNPIYIFSFLIIMYLSLKCNYPIYVSITSASSNGTTQFDIIVHLLKQTWAISIQELLK